MPSMTFEKVQVTATSDTKRPVDSALNVGPVPLHGLLASGLFLGYDQNSSLCNIQGWNGGGKLLRLPPLPPIDLRPSALPLVLQGNGGNVGIGKQDPGARLDVNGADEGHGDVLVKGRFQSNSQHGGGLYLDSENCFVGSDLQGGVGFTTGGKWKFIVSSEGNVGIGKQDPGARLDVNGADEGHGDVLVTGRFQSNSQHGGGLYLDSEDCFVGSDLQGGVGFTTGGKWKFIVSSEGNVGIGIDARKPSAKLAVNGNLQVGALDSSDIVGNAYLEVAVKKMGGYAFSTLQSVFENPVFPFVDMVLNPNGGNVGIGSFGTSSPSATLEVKGNIKVSGDVLLDNADCAEKFAVADFQLAEAGTVMVIDEDGLLRPSNKSYDRRVAGVISGAGDYRPGIILDSKNGQENRLPVALVGKVCCKVDAQFGAVDIGDLLTTSPTPGHAMKAGDPMQAFGAVIGKALRPLQSGQGLIPILVALQ